MFKLNSFYVVFRAYLDYICMFSESEVFKPKNNSVVNLITKKVIINYLFTDSKILLAYFLIFKTKIVCTYTSINDKIYLFILSEKYVKMYYK